MPPKAYLAKGSAMKIGDTAPVSELVKTLDSYGYVRVDTVEGAGQYSLRGDILDIFVPDNEYPLRLEFFGDELDAAGYFDTMTQRRTENVAELTITPVRETVIPPEKYALIEEKIDSLIASALRKKNQTLAESCRQSASRLKTPILPPPTSFCRTCTTNLQRCLTMRTDSVWCATIRACATG